MSYVEYLVAAYAVFVVVLGWEYAVTRLQIRRELRNARLRANRSSARKDVASTQLSR